MRWREITWGGGVERDEYVLIVGNGKLGVPCHREVG